MNPELAKSIHERHSRIFRDPDDSPADPPRYCSLYCGDGWYTLIDVLCEELQRLTDRQGAPQAVLTDVKEKYGSLSFHVRNTSNEQDAMIDLVETLSMRICEVCGAPGVMDERPGVWVTVRCDAHRKNAQQS
ncbi:MAG TPA: hypothetical protein VFJ15_08155 [Oleiagrimonas sp.]|nr:hypothetical protein [Oleiagrimonas sp.]